MPREGTKRMHHFQWCSVPGQRAQTGTSEYVFHVLNLAWLVIIAINNNRKVPLPGSENKPRKPDQRRHYRYIKRAINRSYYSSPLAATKFGCSVFIHLLY